MPSTGYWLQDASKAAVKLVPSANPYGKGTDVNVANALLRFLPDGFAPAYNQNKIKAVEITGVLGSKGVVGASRVATHPVKTYLHYQCDAIETLIGTAFGQSTTPALVSGATNTYRYVYQVKNIIDRWFSAAVVGGLTDSTYNPNGLFYYPCLMPNTLTIEGNVDEFVTVTAENIGWDEIIPLATQINNVSGHTATDTTLKVNSTAGFDESGFLLINRGGTPEIVFYRGIDATNFYNCVRGLLGTTAGTIAQSSTVETLVYTTANLNSATGFDSPIAAFEDIQFYINLQSGAALDGADIMPIKGFQFQIQNNLKYEPDTGTFGRQSQPKRQSFMATLSVDEVFFKELVRRYHYINNAKLKAKIVMSSTAFADATDKKPYQVTIWLPTLQYSGDNPAAAMFGANIPDATHTFECAVTPSPVPSGFPSETTSIGVIEMINKRSTNLIT